MPQSQTRTTTPTPTPTLSPLPIRPPSAVPGRRDLGQATTEYALVLLGAALVALLLIGWATAGGGAGKIGHLLDVVIDAVTGKI